MARFRKKTLRVVEFLIIGILFGLIEDLIAIKTVSNARIDLQTVITVLVISIPFAIVSELVVDHPRFWEMLRLNFNDNINGEGKKK